MISPSLSWRVRTYWAVRFIQFGAWLINHKYAFHWENDGGTEPQETGTVYFWSEVA